MGQCKNHVKPNCDWLVKVFVFSGFRFSGGLYVQPPNKYRICSEPLHVEFFDKRHVLFTCIELCKISFSVLIDFILNESIFWTVEKQIFWISRYLHYLSLIWQQLNATVSLWWIFIFLLPKYLFNVYNDKWHEDDPSLTATKSVSLQYIRSMEIAMLCSDTVL